MTRSRNLRMRSSRATRPVPADRPIGVAHVVADLNETIQIRGVDVFLVDAVSRVSPRSVEGWIAEIHRGVCRLTDVVTPWKQDRLGKGVNVDHALDVGEVIEKAADIACLRL